MGCHIKVSVAVSKSCKIFGHISPQCSLCWGDVQIQHTVAVYTHYSYKMYTTLTLGHKITNTQGANQMTELRIKPTDITQTQQNRNSGCI